MLGARVRDDLAVRSALRACAGAAPAPSTVDDMIDALAALLDRAARFGVLQAGWGRL